MRVLSTCCACSAGAFSNLMVMFGCLSWNSAAIFFIWGSLPTQEKNVTVCGEAGSATGPAPLPTSVFGRSAPPPHDARLRDAASANAMTAGADRDPWILTTPAPYCLEEIRSS